MNARQLKASKRQRAALRGWATRRRHQAERRLARARAAALRLSVGDVIGEAYYPGAFVVVRIDYQTGSVTLNCTDGSES